MDGMINPLTGQPIDDADLQTLSALVTQQLTLEDRIEKGEALLKQLKAELEEVSTRKIPNKLTDLGLSSLTTADGRKVNVKPFYSCKIISPEAYNWLDENGHGGIIKTDLVRSFMRTEREQAIEYQKEHPEFTLKESIHHQTLTAFCKEFYSDPTQQLPAEYFSVFQGSRTTIK